VLEVGHIINITPYVVYQVSYVSTYGANMLRPLFIFYCVERTFATVLLERYEQVGGWKWVGLEES
jgi:hypothetical protein